ncbi:cell division protein FtsQ/DivIB [Bartonella sp. F02]|uniref:cell division protein FtsQ/DivIB n=1 Tax=Bartonella sp. F02 TaxID=2967262 RepID=UPI0022A9D3BF|nr:cell division protein FtsQ/DivIB [Bartonella sp. F02]MCZ2328663.1 cell division protein FtsQ/DivIB [Bartonella sp. F02]
MYALSVEKVDTLAVCSGAFLPRFYRRFSGFVLQFALLDNYVPRHFGSFAVLLFFFLSALYGISSSGRMKNVVKTTTSSVGLMITDVYMSGNKRTAKKDVLTVLGLNAQLSIVDFDVDKARSILEQQPWIQSAVVQKIYPNQIKIAMIEREPYAIWQHNGMVDIIDRTGYVIVPFQADLVSGLPLVVGSGAQKEAQFFIQALSAYPHLHTRIRSYVRVGDRRWDIFLDNGMQIMLPEKKAIERLASLIERGVIEDLLSRNILSIDLRLSDRMTVALSDEELARYYANVKEEERILKKLKAGSL